MKLKFQDPSIKLYWNTHTLIHLHIVSGCFCEELRNSQKPHVPQSSKELLCSPLQRTFASASGCGCWSLAASTYYILLAAAQLLLLCPTLWDAVDCSPPGSSAHGVLQARILEWVAMPSSRGSFWPRDQTHFSCISCIAAGFFTTEPPRRSIYSLYSVSSLTLIFTY